MAVGTHWSGRSTQSLGSRAHLRCLRVPASGPRREVQVPASEAQALAIVVVVVVGWGTDVALACSMPHRTPHRLAHALTLSAILAVATPAAAWDEQMIYDTAAFANTTSVVSVAVASAMDGVYVTYEVADATAGTHTLYLNRWNGTAWWAAPVVLHSHVGTGLWIYNPTIAVRTGHVTVVAHNRNACAGGDVTGLAEYDYDTVTGLVDATRVIDSGCEEVGHAQLQWAAATSTYHVCWTRKTVALSDEVLCSTRPAVGGWAAATNLNGAGLALAQDHASLAVRNTNGSPRYAFHSRVAGGGPDADEAAMQFHGPGGTVTTQTAPSTGALPRARDQQRPFVAVSPDDRIHVAWEDRTGTDSIWYQRCQNATPLGCDADAEWELDPSAISGAGLGYARFPHLHITPNRTWVSFEQEVGGRTEVVAAHRCLTAAPADPWTVEDPNPAGLLDESTEEYGTPHLSSRLVPIGFVFQPGIPPIVQIVYGRELALVARRANAVGGLDAVLYTSLEADCP
jgi:hypothetical protein